MEAARRDHRKLGQELDLFSLGGEVAGGGLVFWHPKGAMVRHLLETFWKVGQCSLSAFLALKLKARDGSGTRFNTVQHCIDAFSGL